MAPGPADALTDPRSFRVFPHGTSEETLIEARGGRCRRRRGGPVDLAVVTTNRRSLAPALRAARENARAVVIPRPDAGALPLPLPEGTLVLGTGSGLWTPNLRVGIAAPLAPRPRRTPCDCLVVSQGPSVAAELVHAAGARGLPLAAAVSTGDLPPGPWIDLVLSLSNLDPQPLLLLGLHRPIDHGALHRIAEAFARAVVLLLGAAGSSGALPAPPELELPDNGAIARALGLPVVQTPEELVEYAWLTARGLRRRSGRVLTISDAGPDEAAVLNDAVALSGLTAVDRRARADLVLLGPATAVARPSARKDALTLRFSPTAYPEDGVAGRATLKAAAVLLSEQLVLGAARAAGRPQVRSRRASRLLDGWPAELHEVRVKELLACYSLSSPPGALVTSPSRAGLVAARLGLPVSVKAVGPGLCGRARRRTMIEGVESVSGTRSAFHRVLQACSRLSPPPDLEGILVSPTQEMTTTLECALLWLPPTCHTAPPLMTVRIRSGPPGSSSALVRALPLSLGAAQQLAEQLAGLGLANRRGRLTAAQVRALGRFLHRLSWLGPDMAGRLRWLLIETLSPPSGRTPPLVIDACAEQTEGYRAHDYMTW